MEPRIQYARTSDGVSIAWAEAGEGMPLLVMPAPGFTHAELSWKAYPPIQGLAARFRTVWYDPRGTGLSDRTALDFSVQALMRDVEAVIAASKPEPFVLVTWSNAVPTAVSYVVAYPQHVTHLITCDGFARGSDLMASPAYRAAKPLLETDWELYRETFGQVFLAHAKPEWGRMLAEFFGACADSEGHKALWRYLQEYDVTALLPEVRTPTLVIQSRNNRLVPMAAGQRLAAAIPGARLSVIEDVPYSAVPDLVEEFVSGRRATARPREGIASGTAIILFADIADSTAMTEQMGDTRFRGKARELDANMRNAIGEHDGTAIEGKLLGDGVLAVFASARQAIEAALACSSEGSQAGLPLHVGLHAGDVIREDNNVYGGAVNIASRVSGLSGPGEVLVSETVRSLARTSAGVRFEDRGEQGLKGVAEPVRVWVVIRGES
jgi:class 3 adenylate cyclase